jgi:hypothetical protein
MTGPATDPSLEIIDLFIAPSLKDEVLKITPVTKADFFRNLDSLKKTSPQQAHCLAHRLTGWQQYQCLQCEAEFDDIKGHKDHVFVLVTLKTRLSAHTALRP